MTGHRDANQASSELSTWFLSCSAAEELLRDMINGQPPSSDTLLAAHLKNCRDAQHALADAGVQFDSMPTLSSALQSLEAAQRAIDAYRYSTDPDIHHIPRLRLEALRMLDLARSQRSAAFQVISNERWRHGSPSHISAS